MEKIEKLTDLIQKIGKLTEEESTNFVNLWNDIFGRTLGLTIQSPAEAYELCTAEDAE